MTREERTDGSSEGKPSEPGAVDSLLSASRRLLRVVREQGALVAENHHGTSTARETLPMGLLPVAREMLLAAYACQFGEGDQLDWKAWGQAAGHGPVEAGRAAADLQGRNLASPAGGRLRVTTAGAGRVERHGLVDSDLGDLIARQYELRRKILQALERSRAAPDDGDPTRGTPAPGSDFGSGLSGMHVEQIAEAVGERSGRVAPAVRVLKEQFLLQAETRDGSGAEPPTFRISHAGRCALPAVRPAWPLSPDIEGTGNRRRVSW